ncbi:MAG: hypothetical protein M3179_11990 [Actinomycetota bacterium]|nr:hypothetical protein [Actinomycetota bacterium]
MSRSSAVPVLAGVLTVGAGLVHATAAGTHAGDSTVVVLMALTALVQVVLGMTVATRPGRLTLVAVAGVNVAVLGAWVATRTTGIPFVAGLGHQESVGLQDLTAQVLGFTGAAAAVVALIAPIGRDPEPVRRVGLSPLWGLALLPALVGMTAPHDHAGGHADGHDHASSSEKGSSALALDPIFSGADTSTTSESQLVAAKSLIEVTRQSVIQRFPDKASLLAAGYRSIGDGFPLTRYEHYVKSEYLTDGRQLDPNFVESVVVEGTGSRARVVSAMYILELGKTMSDVPNIAGELTSWHDHQNLCWDATGTKLAGVLIKGQCQPGGTFRPTAPMLHVWLADNECGPFAGIEGHGSDCASGHGH